MQVPVATCNVHIMMALMYVYFTHQKNKANLRDLLAATDLVILLKLD